MNYEFFRLIAVNIDNQSTEHLKQCTRPKRIKKMRFKRFFLWVSNKLSRLKENISTTKATHENLNNINVGQYLYLSKLSGEDLIFAIFEILYDTPREIVMAMDVESVFGCVNFVRSEIDRLAKMLESTRIEPTREERQAGIDQMSKNGAFGMIDYLSKRQNITIEEAESMKMTTAIALLMIDKNQEEYKRRLQKQFQQKLK